MKIKITIGLLIILILSGIVFLSFNDVKGMVDAQSTEEDVLVDTEDNKSNKSNDNKDSDKKEESKIKVDIKGAVKKPGVYEISSDKRVIDLVKLAGGLNSNANTNYINLSGKLEDEMVVWIYTNKEISDLKLEQESTKYMISNCNCPKVDNTTCLNTDKVNSNTTSQTSNKTSNVSSNIVNINTATEEELMQLDGIGESKARSIIDYRNKNGLFKNIDDIKNVSGIGESVYNKIKDSITI